MANLMCKNEGGLDRAVRMVAGLALVGGAVMGPLAPWGWIGVVPLATGLMGTCPLYSLMGVSTCPTRPSTATKS